jgi:hypothetical protein
MEQAYYLLVVLSSRTGRFFGGGGLSEIVVTQATAKNNLSDINPIDVSKHDYTP